MALNESWREIFFHNKMMSQVMQAHKKFHLPHSVSIKNIMREN